VQPARFAELAGLFAPGLPSAAEILVGADREREDALLPPESQWWNLARGREAVRRRLGTDAIVFGRVRSSNHPQLPGWLTHAGFRHATLLNLDGATLPGRSGPVATWAGPDGRSIDAFARDPLPAHEPATFFNLSATLHAALGQDSAPAVALIHRGKSPAVGYAELVALAELGGPAGEFTTVGRYLGEHHYGDYLGSVTVDDFASDDLDDRVTTRHRPDPVSGFAVHQRRRRRLDGTLALAALYRSLTPEQPGEAERVRALEELEAAVEGQGPDADGPDLAEPLATAEADWARTLADRLQARAEANRPGWLAFNPCGFARRVGLEFPGVPGPIPAGDHVKASEFSDGTARVVVEIPALGYAWIPRPTPGPVPKPKLKTADGTTVRNEFFEAELDPATGGLRAFRDARTRLNRLGYQPVFNPGSKCRARSVTVTHAGAALGEVTAEGEVLDEHDRLLAGFRHRVRAWVGRPALEVSVEFDVAHPPTGYPWHAYFGLRVGWRDERAALYRGVAGLTAPTTASRPVSADFLEIRLGGERTALFTGGLPFLQKHGPRMADVILIPQGETARRFELLVAADRDYPMMVAAGWTAPTPVVATDRGPPGGATSGWLAHLDLPSLLLTSLRPGAGRSVTARLLETAGYGGAADLRFAVPPTAATLIDGAGEVLRDVTPVSGAVPLEFSANEAVRINAEFGTRNAE
jgi:hypothetical protein